MKFKISAGDIFGILTRLVPSNEDKLQIYDFQNSYLQRKNIFLAFLRLSNSRSSVIELIKLP